MELELIQKHNVEVDQSQMMPEFKGLRAMHEFSKFEKIFKVKGKHIDTRTERTLQLDVNEHIDPVNELGHPEPGYYLNHSCDPNAYALVIENIFSKAFTLEISALKFIEIGKEITVDYAFMESEIANPCVCSCGAKQCRGRITGFKELNKEEVEKYLDINIPLSAHLLKLYS